MIFVLATFHAHAEVLLMRKFLNDFVVLARASKSRGVR